nr:MAG TPA_asm: hypothetical protein [Caudoviricetes sp.]
MTPDFNHENSFKGCLRAAFFIAAIPDGERCNGRMTPKRYQHETEDS